MEINQFEWMESMSVGVPVLDEDHKRIINALVCIRQAIMSHDIKDAIETAVVLSVLITDHTQREQDFLRRIRFPSVEDVVAEQNRNTTTINELSKALINDPSRADEIASKMLDAFCSYLMRADICFRP